MMLKKIKKLVMVSLTLAIFTSAVVYAQSQEKKVSSELSWAERMAESTMLRYPEAWQMEDRDDPKWSYSHGVTLTGFYELYEATEDDKYLDYIIGFANTCVNEDGSVINYELEKYNIDRVNGGKFLFEVYEHTGEEKYRIAYETFRDQMRTHPRTSEGGFWHKKRYPHQMWLDGLYMANPFLAEYAHRNNMPEMFDDIANQIILMNKYARDPETGLLYHGWDEAREQSWADPETGLSKNFWGRAMGWYAMAIVDVLEFMPEDHKDRDEVIGIFRDMTDALLDYQDERTGLWYQVLDKGDKVGNYLEATGSTMFVYSMLKAVKYGYLPEEEYLQAAFKGYDGITEYLIKVDADGETHLIKCNHGSGLSDDRDGTYKYYIMEEIGPNDPKGIGPFIMASLFYDELKRDR